MFSFFKKTPPLAFPFAELATDIHSHILPGIDDGSPDVETSITLIKGMQELGFKTFTGTPHVMEDMFRNNTESIMQAHATLQQGHKDAGMDLAVRPGDEYMVYVNVERIHQK